METKRPTPIKLLLLPVEASDAHPAPSPSPANGRGEQALAHPRSHGRARGASAEGDGPRFIPLAVAIDLGMTPPIGSIRTTEVEVVPSTPVMPSRARRHLRLLPDS